MADDSRVRLDFEQAGVYLHNLYDLATGDFERKHVWTLGVVAGDIRLGGLERVGSKHQLLEDQGCEDLIVLHSVPNREALGVFRAVSTQDGEAQARNGQAFYALSPLDNPADETIVEIQFGDGMWMLATPDDLEMIGP